MGSRLLLPMRSAARHFLSRVVGSKVSSVASRTTLRPAGGGIGHAYRKKHDEATTPRSVPRLPPSAARAPVPVRPPRQEALRRVDLALATAARSRPRNRGANGRGVQTASVEAKARRAWHPGMKVGQLHLAAGISRIAASTHRRIFLAEAQPVREEMAR